MSEINTESDIKDCWTLDIEMHGAACKKNANQGYRFLVHTWDDVWRGNTVEELLASVREAILERGHRA